VKIADLFVDLKLDTSGFMPELNKAVSAGSKTAVEVGVKAATSTLSKEVATVVKKATPPPIKVPVQMDEAGGDRAIGVMDTLATRASIAAGGIGDLAGAMQAQGIIGEKTAAVMETTAATIQGVAGVADLSVISMELLKAAKLRDAAASARQTAANITHAAAAKVVTAATYVQATATRVLNAAMRANPIGILITAITGLIAVLVVVYKKNEAFRNIINSAWASIKNAIQNAWRNVIRPAFQQIYSFIQNTLIPIVNRLWKNVIAPAFKAIGTIISAAWHNVIRPIFALYVSYVKNVLAPVITFLYNNVVKPIFTALGRTIKSVWDNVVKPTFEALRTGVGKVKDGFKTAVDGIKKVWDGLKAAAETPVRFVINSVFRPLAEKINDVLPGSPLGVPSKFARGGVLPGYTPGRDVHTFRSPTGGALQLSGGEAIMRPEWTRAMGGPKAIDAMNRRARHGRISRPPGFFLGGVMPMVGATSISQHSGYPWATWAGDLNGLGDDTGKPVVAWKSGYIAGQQSLAGSYGNHIRMNHGNANTLYAHLSSFAKGTGARVAAGEIIGRVGSTGNSSGPHLHFEVAGGGVKMGELGGGSGGGGGSSVLSMIGDVKDAISDTWKSIKGMSGSGWYGVLKDSAKGYINMAIDAINDKIPDFGPIPNNPIPHFDRGGWLEHGRGMVANQTGRPEAVLTSGQWTQMERLIGVLEKGQGGSPLIGHATIRETVDLEKYERQRAFRDRMVRV
jgi:murein DD-endopeptidase MepM/ murein hydrolase activator NlpD